MIYTIENEHLKVSIHSQGASILSMQYRQGNHWIETTLQYENLDDYENKNTYYLNSIIGPHSGRIKNGEYYLGNEQVQLERNDRGNHLHGAKNGFHTLNFKLKTHTQSNKVSLQADDFNNHCLVNVTFSLMGSSLNIEYDVLTYITQVFNMTQHTYFNLDQSDTIENHFLQMDAKKVCLLDESGAPSEYVDVYGPFDFRKKRMLKDAMENYDSQYEITGNLDHPFLINDNAVYLESMKSHLGVAISSTADNVVIYTGNYFEAENDFKGLGPSKLHQAVAIEPQMLPNDVNLGFGKVQVVNENERYNHKIVYKFYDLA